MIKETEREHQMRDIVALIVDELSRANKLYKLFNSAHEGYAVMLEEMDELFDEIRKKRPDKSRMQDEAIQVGAMAIKFIQSCCTEPMGRISQNKCNVCRYVVFTQADRGALDGYDPCEDCLDSGNWAEV